jgi:4-hydroxythreonine-4-phosphate dehydrogenase
LRKRALKIGVTAGDPAGIGPEVSLKAINSIRDRTIIPVLICRRRVLEELYAGIFSGYETIDACSNGQGPAALRAGRRYVCDVPLNLPMPVPGNGSAATGLESLAYVDRAVDLWKSGAIDAIVTAPVSKGHIEKSGTPFTGHTEYIADRIGERAPYMMMYSRKYRVLLATTHLPVSRIRESITEELLLGVMRAGYDCIRSIDRGGVSLAIAGLDPHCGDDGAIGDFDRDVTLRAVERARLGGIPILGPFSADSLFIPSTWKRYNLVIAHYHDQGLIPFKMLAFDRGVNVTLGLSIVRTSADHGTAYDIAGTNRSGFASMAEAIRLAKRLVMSRRGT